MDPEVLFEEVQGTGKKSVRDFFRITTGIFLVALAFNFAKQHGSVSQLTSGLLAGVLICALVSIITTTRLVTQIRTDGIYVKFSPHQPSFNRYSWEIIERVYLRNFDALTEYNGWGMKFGVSGKGYIISGDTGIQIELRNKSKVLISTRQPEKVAAILRNLKQLG